MKSQISYASIAVVEALDSGKIIVEAISVTPEECSLSGAWKFETKEAEDLKNVLQDKIIISLNASAELKDYKNKFVSCLDFLAEAITQNANANLAWNSFLYGDYVKRKKISPPSFCDWRFAFSLISTSDYLKRAKEEDSVKSGDPDFANVLSYSILVKRMIDSWRQDQSERLQKTYLENNRDFQAILPKCWLSVIP